MHMLEFSVIIPVYNSEYILSETVLRISDALKSIGKTFEIILVDDGSMDKSWQVIETLKKDCHFITGIRLRKNYGQHNAILCGINEATGHYIITIDDDMEQNPEDIKLLYQTIISGSFDLVYAVPSNIKKNIVRLITTKIYKKISSIENKKAGEGSSFRMFNAELKNNIVKHEGPLFFIDEIALWYTDKIGYIKVNYNASQKKHSGYSADSLIKLSLQVISLSSTMPLRLVRIVGFYIFVASVLLASYLIYRRVVHDVVMGYTSLMVAILFGTGIITASLGIIGEYLGNLISLSNKKPSYSIKEKI